jgi:hypothetical protein
MPQLLNATNELFLGRREVFMKGGSDNLCCTCGSGNVSSYYSFNYGRHVKTISYTRGGIVGPDSLVTETTVSIVGTDQLPVCRKCVMKRRFVVILKLTALLSAFGLVGFAFYLTPNGSEARIWLCLIPACVLVLLALTGTFSVFGWLCDFAEAGHYIAIHAARQLYKGRGYDVLLTPRERRRFKQTT